MYINSLEIIILNHSKKEDVIIQEEGVEKDRRKKLQEKMERLKRREQK